MKKTVLVRGARQLLTLRGPARPRRGAELRNLGIIEDGALLIVDGIVAEAGPSRTIEQLAAARRATRIDATGKVVLPGFVDSHTHLVCGPPRLVDYEMRIAGSSYEEIAAAGGGILSSVKAVRAASASRLERSARETLGGLIRHGTTTVEAKSGYGLDEASELKTLRVTRTLDQKPLDVVATFLGAHVTPPEFQSRSAEYIEWLSTRLLPVIGKRRLARFADVFCERGAFTVTQARRYLEAAQRCGMAAKIHAEQFSNSGGLRMAVELGAASADHLEQADRSDAHLLARSSTIATLLPGSVFHLGLERYAPARLLIEAGAAVALATDCNPGTSPTCSMPMVLSLACAQMRMTPAEAISAATINGAHALGMADRVGSLERGKQADLVVMNCADYREIPYRFGVNLVALTMKKGETLYQQQEVAWPES